MSFNYGKEERKWRLWKEAEEKQLRSFGISEDAIEQLRIHDRKVFKSERRFYQRLQNAGTYLEENAWVFYTKNSVTAWYYSEICL